MSIDWQPVEMTPHTDLRRHPRYPFVAPIQVWWQDGRGFQWQDHGDCLDTSDGGLKMELPRAVPVNIRIKVRLSKLDLDSSVLVRHCTRRSSKFIIGVAFQRTPSEALQAAPALHERPQHSPEQDASLESSFTIAQPPDDEVRT